MSSLCTCLMNILLQHFVTLVSGMIAKEKREKDDKSFSKVLPPRPPTRRRRYTADAVSSQLQPPNFTLYHPLLPSELKIMLLR
jgi:hypothetical protein